MPEIRNENGESSGAANEPRSLINDNRDTETDTDTTNTMDSEEFYEDEDDAKKEVDPGQGFSARYYGDDGNGDSRNERKRNKKSSAGNKDESPNYYSQSSSSSSTRSDLRASAENTYDIDDNEKRLGNYNNYDNNNNNFKGTHGYQKGSNQRKMSMSTSTGGAHHPSHHNHRFLYAKNKLPYALRADKPHFTFTEMGNDEDDVQEDDRQDEDSNNDNSDSQEPSYEREGFGREKREVSVGVKMSNIVGNCDLFLIIPNFLLFCRYLTIQKSLE